MSARRTVVVRVDPLEPDRADVERAASVLREGGLVAFPTETVYGLGANALDARAVARIFEAKGRPATNPLIVHVLGAAEARRVVADWPAAADALTARFWPGPLTLVLPKALAVPIEATAGLDTVAVRAPSHPVARALLELARTPIAAPSANPSTSVSPTTAAHVLDALDGRIDLVLDGGPCDVGIESTVVSLAAGERVLLRPGSVARADVEDVVGPLDDATAATAGEAAPSPGMAERHYAPRTPTRLVREGDAEELVRVLAGASRPGAILRTLVPPSGVDSIVLSDEPRAYARGLYAALHALDARTDRIAVEAVPDHTAWDAVRDRLMRATRR